MGLLQVRNGTTSEKGQERSTHFEMRQSPTARHEVDLATLRGAFGYQRWGRRGNLGRDRALWWQSKQEAYANGVVIIATDTKPLGRSI